MQNLYLSLLLDLVKKDHGISQLCFVYKDQSIRNFELSYNERTQTAPIFEKQNLIGYEIRNVSNFD